MWQGSRPKRSLATPYERSVGVGRGGSQGSGEGGAGTHLELHIIICPEEQRDGVPLHTRAVDCPVNGGLEDVVYGMVSSLACSQLVLAALLVHLAN